MSDTVFSVNPPEVRNVGLEIEGDAQELIGPPGQYTLDDFQTKFNTIKQTNFPVALQGTLGNFIKDQYDGYKDILQNREAIGLLLQNKVATDSEVTDVMTKKQFQAQLAEIQQESH
jgi:hypothetical protein